MKDPRSEVVARAWLDAITRRDRAGLIATSHPQIRMYGPRGIGVGHEVLLRWFDGTPMRISVRDLSSADTEVRVDQHIEWLAEDGSVASAVDMEATLTIEDGKVAAYRRADWVAPPAAEDS